MKYFIYPLCLALICLSTSQAATFQYIFNNVEQGAGGVSNPSITVDGNRVKKNGVPVSAEETATPPADSGDSVASTSSAEIPASPDETPPLFHRVRLMAAGARLLQSAGSDWRASGADLRRLRNQESGATASLALTLQASRDVGFTGFWLAPGATGRQVLGAEVEFVPVRVAVLGKQDFMEAGALFGASTLGREFLKKTGTFHAGGRLNVNFHRQLGITGAVRSNLTDRRQYRYTQAEIGLAYRF